ncbi:MAG: flagellar filament capping protein FliD [Methyloversatilis sp.]|nr:flagellar filament capping protein FliD [Methyloversatilis sp.]
MASSLAFGTNLDINSIVTQLMTVEKRPLTLLAAKQSALDAKISSYGMLKSAFSTLQTAAEGLSKADVFAARKATIADGNVATVAASTTATPGNYSIEVSSLARAQVTASAAFAGGSSATVGSGTLTIELGSYSGGAFTVNPDKTPVTVTIPNTATSLGDVRDAINAANAGVTASLLNDGTGTRLVIASKEGGTANTVRITANDSDGDNTDAAGLSRLTYDASTGGSSNMSEKVTATNALLKVNGIDVVSSTNTLTNTIEGVTLTLKNTNVGSPTALTVSNDSSGAKAAVEKLVKSYNDAILTIKNQTAYNSTTDKGAALSGESTVLSLRSRLASVVTGEIAPGVSLASIGVSVQKDGSLKVDSDKLATALDNGKAKALFVGSTGVTGLASRIDSMIAAAIDDEGLIGNRLAGMDDAKKAMKVQEERLNTRMDLIEARYRRQFSALDSMISSMNQTSAYLTKQLASLSSS